MALLGVLFGGAFAPKAWGHTPESPEVQALIMKGAEFLRTSVLQGVPPAQLPPGQRFLSSDSHNDSWGAQMLAGLVWYKITNSEDDPVVAKALARTKEKLNEKMAFGPERAYETCICIIFLAEVSPEKYRPELQKALDYLLSQQQKCGAWMYNAPNGDGAGDTSVTQYAILALWSAKNAGLQIPEEVVVRVCTWLVRTQDVSGAFYYLPTMPGPSGRARSGAVIRSSMTIAGAGSLYICADLLKMNLSKNKALEGDDGLPRAFRLVNRPGAQLGRGFDESLRGLQREVEQGIVDAERIIAAQFPFNDQQYLFYTYYSYERFQSLKEYATKRVPKEPEWYNQFVKIARETQNPDGSWVKGTGRVSDTAFMCLALQRSMKKTLAKAKNTEGTLVGGRGLPGDTSKVVVKRGKVVGGEQTASKEDILKVLDSPDGAMLDDLLESAEGSLLDAAPETRAAQLAKIRTTLIEGDYAARRAAVKLLATDDHLDNAPLLIFALSDPDMEVVRSAEAGLRRISRRLTSVEIPENASKEDREKRINAWKAWYKNLRPDAIFLK